MKNEISTKKAFIALKSEINKQRVLILLIAAAILLLSVYVANIFHLLDEPLFSLVYYGNLNGIFYTEINGKSIAGYIEDGIEGLLEWLF